MVDDGLEIGLVDAAAEISNCEPGITECSFMRSSGYTDPPVGDEQRPVHPVGGHVGRDAIDVGAAV